MIEDIRTALLLCIFIITVFAYYFSVSHPFNLFWFSRWQTVFNERWSFVIVANLFECGPRWKRVLGPPLNECIVAERDLERGASPSRVPGDVGAACHEQGGHGRPEHRPHWQPQEKARQRHPQEFLQFRSRGWTLQVIIPCTAPFPTELLF